MKKLYLITVLLLSLNLAFSQWTKIASVPSADIVALRSINNIIYAASRTIIYKSSDGGVAWNSVRISNNPLDITSLEFYNNKIYVGTFNQGVFFSSDNGNTWQNNGADPKFISSFAVKNNILYASTLGNGIAVMNPNTNNWSLLNNSLPSYSINVQSIIGSPNFLLIAAGSNGTFYRYNFNNSSWNEEYYDGILHPGLQISKLVNDADTIFAVNFNRIIKSTNAGLTWTNDKQGTEEGFYRTIYSGSTNYYTLTDLIPTGTLIQQRNKHAAIGTTWATDEEFLPDGFAYDIIEFNNKLFLGKADGLYVKDLGGAVILPVHFSSFNATCDKSKVILAWKTAQEQNSSHFEIETSTDGIHWTVIGNLASAGNSAIERSYSFTDNNPVANNSYRIAAYAIDGSVHYTNELGSSCTVTDLAFTLWPNPASDIVFVNLASDNTSQATIKLFDNKGALIKIQKTTLSQGGNQVRVDIGSLPGGVYTLHADWNAGKNKKAVQVIKQ